MSSETFKHLLAKSETSNSSKSAISNRCPFSRLISIPGNMEIDVEFLIS